MQPKGKLFVLLAVVVAIGLVTASGAFTTVTAQRTATVSVAGDDAALLGLEPADTSNGGQYASTSGGQLQITLDNINLDATTTIDGVVNVTNRGSQSVGVWIVKSGDNTNLVEFYNGTSANNDRLDNSSSEAVTLDPGESIQVSIVVDTTGAGLSANADLLDDIEVHADADEA